MNSLCLFTGGGGLNSGYELPVLVHVGLNGVYELPVFIHVGLNSGYELSVFVHGGLNTGYVLPVFSHGVTQQWIRTSFVCSLGAQLWI